ncbi:thermostable hemolysin [Propionivibrio limicola]|uniref:thermostable hemolysin n=1 Tax=Propionivibrio limicola TaxID=167645 RepID=UPI001FE8027B|nr:thermostable hemolysin [Propionivibrio limicola]
MRAVRHARLEETAASEHAADAMANACFVEANSPRRAEAEGFIREIFRHHHAAHVRSFAPNLMLLEREQHVVAAAGWRAAADEPLFLERYLDEPIEKLMERLTGLPFPRARLVEVGHLASDKPGGSLHVILTLARHLHAAGYEWVVFTATHELVRIFTKLGLPLLALAKADPSRLGEEAQDWGRYYDTRPVVVAGRIRHALEKIGDAA